jgi:hypothetical protein
MYFEWNSQLRKKALLCLAGFLFLCTTQNAYSQANSSYIETLEGEASGMKLDAQTRVQPQKEATLNENFGKIEGGAISDLSQGFTHEQFEDILKNNYIGSYLFYKRLNEEQKAEVFSYYQSNPDPQKVRQKILQVNKAQ